MSGWTLFWVLLFVFAVVLGNLMLLKRTAHWRQPKAKLPKGVKPQPYEDDDD